MRDCIFSYADRMTQTPISVVNPRKNTSICVFSVPHSGRNYTPEFLADSQLTAHQIRNSEDAFVDDLMASAPDHGATLITTSFPRAYVDLNRAADELDTALIEGALELRGNPRVAAGLGVIPRVVSFGMAIRAGKITMEQARVRLDAAYHPFHAQLLTLLDRSVYQHGESLLIDCHSMPRSALANITVRGGKRPDIVVGDRFGSSCAPEIADQVERAFLRQDFIVARNLPFAGAHILRTYGRPLERRNAVQVEIDRSIYMDEERLEPNSDYASVKERLGLVTSELAKISQAPLRYAAE